VQDSHNCRLQVSDVTAHPEAQRLQIPGLRCADVFTCRPVV
jgi:hypothetical protein